MILYGTLVCGIRSLRVTVQSRLPGAPLQQKQRLIRYLIRSQVAVCCYMQRCKSRCRSRYLLPKCRQMWSSSNCSLCQRCRSNKCGWCCCRQKLRLLQSLAAEPKTLKTSRSALSQKYSKQTSTSSTPTKRTWGKYCMLNYNYNYKFDAGKRVGGNSYSSPLGQKETQTTSCTTTTTTTTSFRLFRLT